MNAVVCGCFVKMRYNKETKREAEKERWENKRNANRYFLFFFYFNLYIYPPDSQESDGGAIHRVGNYPDLLPEMPRYCCPLVI